MDRSQEVPDLVCPGYAPLVMQRCREGYAFGRCTTLEKTEGANKEVRAEKTWSKGVGPDRMGNNFGSTSEIRG